MNRRDVLKRIQKAVKAADLIVSIQEGAGHTKVRVGETPTVVARHNEINEFTAIEIFKQLEPALGKRWWKK